MSAKPKSLWRNADFLKLWAGQTISMIGSEVTGLALPLTAALTLNATPAQMGILGAVQYAPALLLGLFAGVWIDRVRRRPILIFADMGRALLLASIPIAILLGAQSMNYLYGVAFAVGGLTVLFSVAYQAYLPSLVEKAHLVDANGRLEGSRVFAFIVGSGLAGALVQLLTAPIAILADACSFLVSVFSLAIIRTPEPKPVRGAERKHIFAEIGEGLRMTFGHPQLRPIVITSAIFNLFAAILNSLLVLYLVRDLHFSPVVIGVASAVAGVAGLLAALIVGRVTRWFGVGRTLVGATLLISGGWLIVPLMGSLLAPSIPIVTLAASLGAMGDVFYNVNAISVIQAVTPNRLRGRVSASVRFTLWGLQPIGALAGGFIGQTYGLQVALFVSSAGFLSAFLWALFSPIRRMRAHPTPSDDEGANENDREDSATEAAEEAVSGAGER
jgi:MFS family permease